MRVSFHDHCFAAARLLALVVFLGGAPVSQAAFFHKTPPAKPAVEPIEFDREIKPLLAKYCYSCHGEKKQKADLSLEANLGKPQINGNFSTSGARASDPASNTRLEAINVSGSISGETITLQNVSASLGAGGRISAAGTISTDAAAGFPANIRIGLDHARYADGQMVVATVNGTLTVAGGLTRDPVLGGNLDIERAEITIPSSFGGGPASPFARIA